MHIQFYFGGASTAGSIITNNTFNNCGHIEATDDEARVVEDGQRHEERVPAGVPQVDARFIAIAPLNNEIKGDRARIGQDSLYFF